MFGFDFVTLRKEEGGDWNVIEDAAVAILQRVALQVSQSGLPAVPVLEDGSGGEEGEVVEAIRELLATSVRPSVQADGGDVQFCGFRDGVVFLALTGACSSCPSSTATVRVMIRNLLCHKIEEVKDVRAVDEDDPFAKGYSKGVKVE